MCFWAIVKFSHQSIKTHQQLCGNQIYILLSVNQLYVDTWNFIEMYVINLSVII